MVAVVVVLNSQTEECHLGQDIVNASLVHLAHDLVQVLFLLLHHILRLVDVDVSLLIFLGSCCTVLPHVSPDLG